jgi:hypothetical protein
MSDMIAAAVLALGLFGSGALFDPAQSATVHRRVGGWTVKLARDRFTGAVSCWMNKGRVEFRGDVLVFHADSDVDTDDAVFRIDGGPGRSVREATYEDQRRGYFRDGGPLENPSSGKVALPSFYVTGAKWVYIRANPRRSPVAFDVRRFADALALARSMNCPGIGP